MSAAHFEPLEKNQLMTRLQIGGSQRFPQLDDDITEAQERRHRLTAPAAACPRALYCYSEFKYAWRKKTAQMGA